MTVAPIEDLNTELFNEDAMQTPCEGVCNGAAAAEYWLAFRKHEPCDDGKRVVLMYCVACKNLALDPTTLISCAVCDHLRLAHEYLLDLGPL